MTRTVGGDGGCPPTGEHGSEKAHPGVITTGIRRWICKPACKVRQKDVLMMIRCGRAGDMFIKGGPLWRHLLKVCSLFHSIIIVLLIKFSYHHNDGQRYKPQVFRRKGLNTGEYLAFRETGGCGASRK